jgi:hypothetical protein
VPDRRQVFAVNRRNDQATGNEAFTYWFLGAHAAAWPVAFDPGLADRADVQRDVVDDLCRRRAPVIQHTFAYPLGRNQPRNRPGSRYLDEFVGLSYRNVASNDLFRIMLPQPGPCRRPEATSTAELRRRRAALLAGDDLPAAGALSVLALERVGRSPALEDVAGAILGGYLVPDAALPPGPAGEGLRRARDAAPTTPATPAPAVSGPPLLRLAVLSGYVAGRTGALPGDTAAAEAAREPARERPGWTAALRVLFAFQPYSDAVYRDLRDRRGESTDLERWRFDAQRAAGEATAALATARRLERLLADRPLDRGRVLTDLAATLARAGDAGCAAAALAAADRIPGLHAPPPDGAPPCDKPIE